MKKSTRALVGLAVIEALLLGGTAWMVAQVRLGNWQTAVPGEAIATITRIGGGAMGLVAAFLLIAFFVHRKNGN